MKCDVTIKVTHDVNKNKHNARFVRITDVKLA